jgi:CDP-diacylglycerol---serine O-phosphatidyltransferase
LRLARFNIGNRMPLKDSNSFQGVPSPAGAMLVMLPIYLSNALDDGAPYASGLVAVWMVICGALMVGRFRTPSFKRVTVYSENVSFVLLAFVALVAALVTYPWTTLALLVASYLAMLVFSFLRRRPVRSEPVAPKEPPAM